GAGFAGGRGDRPVACRAGSGRGRQPIRFVQLCEDVMTLQLKRIYEPASDDDGARILVDRLWPRGVSKQKAALADWMKDVAPSAELREWFGHEPARWDEFRKRYR